LRKFRPMSESQSEQQIRPTLRTSRPAAAYARRSPSYAKDEKKDKTQSRDMQTEDIKEWAIEQRWDESDFHPYFSDFGLSGTLRPDQRADMLRLFDDIDAGKFDHGSVICYQESRLFRDETQIYYNQFIDKCKQHDIVVVVISPYVMIYDFRDDFLTEMFRWKCKEAADFIKRHVKGWMQPARYRAAWHDGEWAGMGNIPTGFIVDFDEKSPTYKKLIPYWPHAEKKNELRRLFVELGCDLGLLFKRLREAPIVFPEFEPWVDPKNVNKFCMSKHPAGGYSPRDKGTIIGMLTDPSDIGYRVIKGVIRRDSRGEKLIDHEPIVKRELFELCYTPLAETDLDGGPIKEKKARRYFHRESEDEFGLLKFRIRSNHGEVFTHPSRGRPAYIDKSPENEILKHYKVHAVIPGEELDTFVVDRLMQHAQEVSAHREDVAEYERQAKRKREERQSKFAQIEKSILDIDKEQGGLTRNLGKLEKEIEEAEKAGDEVKKALKERRKQLIEEEIETLEVERMSLAKAKSKVEGESESVLGSLNEEIKKLADSWTEYSFEKRRSLINFLIKEVIIETLSTHWMRVEVLWLHEEWGREEMYYVRGVGYKHLWAEEEDAIVREHYATMPRGRLMALLPDRGWDAIVEHCRLLGLSRREMAGERIIVGAKRFSHSDLEFMRRKGWHFHTRCTKWERLY
jgi:F0F1-type ATP synthase membrane subunit b/b'